MVFGKLLSSLDFGKAQETIAERHLRAAGLRLLCKNYRSPFGEIDLIMADTDVLAFIEVRYRRSANYGGAAASVTASKRKKIRQTAAHYLQQHPSLAHNPCRFDVISMHPEPEGKASHRSQIDWIKNAFE